MTDMLETLTTRLLEAARRAGAEAADALALDQSATGIDIRAGKLEQAERSEAVEVGLRVLMGGRQACVSVSDLSDTSFAMAAERAVAMAREAPEDPYAGLADPSQLARGWDLAALQLADDTAEPSPFDLEADARQAEAAALSRTGIVQVEASASYSRRAVHLAGTNGFSGGYARTSRSVSAVAFTGEGLGMERDWAGESRIFQRDLPSAQGVGDLAAERALERVGARRPKTGAYPVLFDERIASSLIGHLLQAVNGASVARGAGWLRDRLGEQVLPKGLSVIEDPLRVRTSGSRPFDAEGLASRRREIVTDGVLNGWTLDLATARKLGMNSTASASRGPTSPPSPASSNVDLTQGSASRADLIAQMGTGLLVTSLIGSSINGTTGDYSRGASGFWVENGEITHPVNELTIAGNLRDMLMRITLANDARMHLSTRVPSLLVEGLTLAGS
ncbi:TldD/PmbA family protein [Falsirhodobacter sp. 20TX0035]|uniref:TldD/PmbA family protein n=1 Tax=Falsirhodobacter sp. 20TX0035 TaxID=3022019 RepID=UPI00232E1E44|nr:TldD/PmbA family protein [Falsirhodobacter sp. 20TX0035]MDB6452560.1 TldD/PmbA family protein [Falsirhodobacter sp. 20TX0035]